MRKTHPAMWGAGWAGLTIGTVVVLVGVAGSGDVARLAIGYGMMTIGSALYLLAGLKLRERLIRRGRAAARAPMSGKGTVSARP